MTAVVITFQGAYAAPATVSLCAWCIRAGDHDYVGLGPVLHGAHDGECDGANHGVNRGAVRQRRWDATIGGR